MFDTTMGGIVQQAARWLEMPLFTHPDWFWLAVPATLAVTGIWFVNLQLGKQTVREYGEPSLIAPFS